MIDQVLMLKKVPVLHKATHSKWNEQDLEYLENNILYKTYKELAEDLGRTYGAIKYKVHKLGLSVNERSLKDDLPLIMDMLDQGLSYDQIADKMDCSKNTVYQLLLPYQPSKEQRYNLILENYNRLG